MAINNPNPRVTYDIHASTRAPIAGDIASQFNIKTLQDDYAMYDGKNWVMMNNTSTTTIAPTGSTYTTVSAAANAWKSDLYVMFSEHVRVAEYINDKGKIERVQLEWREGNNSRWEPITRVQIKL